MKRYFTLLENAFVDITNGHGKGNQKAGCLFFLFAGLHLVFAFWSSPVYLVNTAAFVILSYISLT